jgi:hypothetical protein
VTVPSQPPAYQYHLGDPTMRFWFFNRIWGNFGCQRTLNLQGTTLHGGPRAKDSSWIASSSLPWCKGSLHLIIMIFSKALLS